jgi:glc operon protein GlcG
MNEANHLTVIGFFIRRARGARNRAGTGAANVRKQRVSHTGARTASSVYHSRSHSQTWDSTMLTLEDAHRITLAARRAAAENNWNVVIAVVDDGGHLISLERMDGTQKGSVRVAEQKARTAIMFKRPTKAFEDAVLQGRPVMMTMPDMICLEGGLPLIRDGVYVGAIGVSGVKSSEDGIVAAQGASALGA